MRCIGARGRYRAEDIASYKIKHTTLLL